MPSTGLCDVVADRIGALLGRVVKLGGIGHELPRDRIVPDRPIDQRRPSPGVIATA